MSKAEEVFFRTIGIIGYILFFGCILLAIIGLADVS